MGLIEDLAAAPFPQALADFARLDPDAALEVVSAPGPYMREAFSSGRIHIALCDPSYLPGLPPVLFSPPCRWRTPVLDALEANGRPWRVVFESTSLAAVQAAVRAGLGAAALLPACVEPGTAAYGGRQNSLTSNWVSFGEQERKAIRSSTRSKTYLDVWPDQSRGPAAHAVTAPAAQQPGAVPAGRL
ncbi:LysR substrate-binding domain-containing protein [Streptomyces virginiae]|uniref:LysR substrate-binding domain-containing protein n=1 Tax=Streptomyces virginiae TaxID=1961 RepID=UPI0037007540